MTAGKFDDNSTGSVDLRLRVPEETALKLAELAFRRRVTMAVLVDEMASAALVEDEVSRRLGGLPGRDR